MPEMPLKLHTLLVGHSIKRKWIQKFKEARDLRYICQNQSDKACFPHDMFSPWKTAPQKLLRDILQKVQNMLDVNVDLLQWFIFFW